ncbi:hypothetical protein JYU14_00165 [Simkania negevensis]|uniref:Superoxide dismutase n=1 Tax=Simkania negevensis TaxID=83561 RepID=A0ABS3AQC5_9BACT|nr:hypothetical protein [Simkania negevensis]
MKKVLLGLALSALTLMPFSTLSAHCQMPCGIYHDDLVWGGLYQDVETIEKAYSEMIANQGSTSLERNQFVRWVDLKDHAADEITRQVSTYFIQQRIKPDDSKLETKLLAAYDIMHLAMVAKQTVDPAITTKLKNKIDAFQSLMKK